MDSILFDIQRNASNQIVWQDGQKEEIVRLYIDEKMSINKMTKTFGIHYNTVKKILTEFGVPLRSRSESHFKDERQVSIFNKIDTEEKAYWLGFLAADGCISGNYIIIALQYKDREHLVKFQNFVQATSVKIQDYYKADTKGNQRQYSRFAFACKEMAEDLKKHGIVENKSLILQHPNIPTEFEMDWIRGYFDGDGGLSYSKKDNRWQSYANSTKQVLSWICEKLELKTKPFNQKHYGKLDNVWRIHFNGRINVFNAWNKLYKQDTATVFLDRKFQLYQKLKETFN